MRIILANKFYYNRGGDCTYTIDLEQLLKAHGHEVAIFAMDFPENLPTTWQKYFPSEVNFRNIRHPFEAFIRPLGSREVATKFRQLIEDFRPDVVHLGNIHSQLSPLIAEIAHRAGIRVVWTVHDHKFLCPRYDCLRHDSTRCRLCDTNPIHCIKHRCIKHNALASVLGYVEACRWNRQRLCAATDAFIVPSRYMRQRLLESGFEAEKVVHLPHFFRLSSEAPTASDEREDYICFVGRIAYEKGITTLLAAMKEADLRLKVIGDGPLLGQLRQEYSPYPHIEFLGFKNRSELCPIVAKAKFVVIPSLWYETFGLTASEALSLGTPILVSHLGALPEFVNSANGRIFEAENVDALRNAISEMWETAFDYDTIRQEAAECFLAEKYYDALMRIYSPALS